MPVDFIRDHAMYAAIFGFFAMIWFGMAQENPPKSWRFFLALGSILSTLVAAAGIYLAIQHWNDATALTSQNVYWAFGVIATVEFICVGVGSILLTLRHKKQYIAAWIALVVGAHFYPLIWIFQDSSLFFIATLVCLAPFIAIALSKRTGISISALTSVGVGVVLIVAGIRGLVLTLT